MTARAIEIMQQQVRQMNRVVKDLLDETRWAPNSAFSIDVVPPLRWHRPPSTITLDLPDDADDRDRMDDDGGVQPGATMVMDS